MSAAKICKGRRVALQFCKPAPKLADSLLAVPGDETVFRVTNSRYHANPSSDRVFFRRRCNGLTLQQITTASPSVKSED